MDWMPVVTTAAGAVIALSGTVLADMRRDRELRTKERAAEGWTGCIEFVLAVNRAHGALHAIASSSPEASADTSGDDVAEAARAAIAEAGVYPARERLLITAPADIVPAGEQVVEALSALRDAVRSAGGSTASPAYHEAYHRFAERLWGFRMTLRRIAGHAPLAPGALGKIDWSERATCEVCSRAA